MGAIKCLSFTRFYAVDLSGFEPLTSSLQMRRSTN